MRCLSCKYDLRNLTAQSDHRCPECGRVFDPDDPRTWSKRPRRAWPRPAVFLPIMFVAWVVLTSVFFIDLVRVMPADASYAVMLAETAAAGFILTLVISIIFLAGFALGRR
jgi:hypothetical protein